MGEEPRGNVRVTAPPAMVTVLIPFLAEFFRRYPKISIELWSSQRIEDLVEQSIDLAIRIGTLGDSSLIARRVGHMITGLFASKGYVRSNGSPNKPADLARHNCILFRGREGGDTWRLRDGRRQITVEVAGSFGVDDIPSLHQAILAGMGIGSMSFLASSRSKEIVRILPRYTSGDLPISLVSPSKRLEPARVVLFRDFLADKLAGVSWRA